MQGRQRSLCHIDYEIIYTETSRELLYYGVMVLFYIICLFSHRFDYRERILTNTILYGIIYDITYSV